ncbi:hypothetical protein Pan216_51230 [Planctomycetes bacterium Pan216]|uniref:Inner membrane protein YhjD n=2 Tax=Kolteria novifilia TaxID=2527975 RepID=A0A518BB72_9BACT|nr:hypothetical protein Pan216_51230 [Planctomycetes bacterium Pan216]
MRQWLKDELLVRLWRTVNKWMDDYGSMMAASMAYWIAFSFFPLLIIVIAMFGLIVSFSDSASDQYQLVISSLSDYFAKGLSEQIANLLGQVRANAGVGGLLGLGILLLNIIGMFLHLQSSFDRIWDVKRPTDMGMIRMVREFIVSRGLRFLLLIAGLWMLVVTMFAMGLVMSAFRTWVSGWIVHAYLPQLAQTLVTFGIYVGIFGTLYRTMPRVSVPWRDVWLGAIMAALTWELGREVLAWFVIGDKYSAYGVVGAFIAMMVWAYYASTIFFFFAEFVCVTHLDRRVGTAEEHATESNLDVRENHGGSDT